MALRRLFENIISPVSKINLGFCSPFSFKPVRLYFKVIRRMLISSINFLDLMCSIFLANVTKLMIENLFCFELQFLSLNIILGMRK